MRRLLAVVALALIAAPAAGATRITVYAAASLTGVFPLIDPAPRYNFAGSDQLAFAIRQGAPADVYAAASPKYPHDLYLEGLLSGPKVFATNRLTVIVPRSNPAGLHSVYDLRRRGIKLVIGQRGVPIGDYTRAVLGRLGLTDALANVVSEETDVKQIVVKVALGEADAGFVYRTDVRPVAAEVSTLRIPESAQPTVQYEIGVVVESRHSRAAQAFVRRVLGPVGRRALARAAFGLPRR